MSELAAKDFSTCLTNEDLKYLNGLRMPEDYDHVFMGSRPGSSDSADNMSVHKTETIRSGMPNLLFSPTFQNDLGEPFG